MEEKGKEKVELEEFMYWLQLTMAKKQKQSLSGVTERFESIFLILRSLLNTTIKLNQIVCHKYIYIYMYIYVYIGIGRIRENRECKEHN